jgi:hypothetical protein
LNLGKYDLYIIYAERILNPIIDRVKKIKKIETKRTVRIFGLDVGVSLLDGLPSQLGQMGSIRDKTRKKFHTQLLTRFI